MSAIHLTKEEFLTRVADYVNSPSEWKFLGDKPAIVDFFATWCGPCKRLGPVLDELSEEYAGQVDIYKVDVDAEEEVAQVFGIRSVPSLLLIPQNEAPQMAAGAMPKPDLKKVIDEFLLKKNA